MEVPGAGEAAAAIGRPFAEHREIRDMMIYLQGYGVTPGLAARIYRHYGDTARRVIEENPTAWPTRSGIGSRQRMLAADGAAP